jgi:hypothetical protein
MTKNFGGFPKIIKTINIEKAYSINPIKKKNLSSANILSVFNILNSNKIKN